MRNSNGAIYQGVGTWSNCDRYEGTVEDYRRHGIGNCTWANGIKYSGEWAVDDPNGMGAMT